MSDAPAFGHSPTGNQRYWTRERIIVALETFITERRGPLPCSDDGYNPLKCGRSDLPTASRVYDEFGSFARAYLAAGASMSRVSMHNVDWTPDEEDILFANAGVQPLRTIARRLGRSYGAVRARLNKNHGRRARDVQAYRSAAQIAQLYQVSVHRVLDMVRSGELKAFKRLGRWQVDLRDAEAVRGRLARPKETHRSIAPDVGDYYQRYNIRRRRTADGRVERYEVSA